MARLLMQAPVMAKTRKRTETATIEAEAPANQPESPEPRRDASTNGDTERIAARAYELYLARGGTHGSDWDDWLAAERELAGTRPDSEER
jgi:hypothetical protein